MATVSTEKIDKRISKLRETISSLDQMKTELKELESAKDQLEKIAGLLPSRGPRGKSSGGGGTKRRGRPKGSKNA